MKTSVDNPWSDLFYRARYWSIHAKLFSRDPSRECRMRSCQKVISKFDGCTQNIVLSRGISFDKQQQVLTMKTSVADPWSNGTQVSNGCETNGNEDGRFEDSFVNERLDTSRLSDSEQYLARLYSRLKSVKGGTSKKDLINSLSNAKEDCIARLVTNGQRFESEEEAMLAANPVIRHIAPHLQALTASELIHLLKADVLQSVTDEQNGEEGSKTEMARPEIEPDDAEQSHTESDLNNCKSNNTSESEHNPTQSEQSSLEENANGEQ